MKNNYLILTTLFLSLFLSLFLLSCSKEDIAPPVVFENLSASKNLSFTNDAITLNIEGSDFTDIEFIFSDAALTSTKIDETTYEIKSSKALLGNVRVDLINGDDIQTKTIDLEFVEHGVIASNIVEGIKIDLDTSDRILVVLGEPDYKGETSVEYFWQYSFGVTFRILKETTKIISAELITNNLLLNGIPTTGYPYSINGIIDFRGAKGNRMDKVVDKLNVPTLLRKIGDTVTSAENFKRVLRPPPENIPSRGSLYQYVYFYNNNFEHVISVTFFSDDINNYRGIPIRSIKIL